MLYGRFSLIICFIYSNIYIHANSSLPTIPTSLLPATWYLYICSLNLCLYSCFANQLIYTVFSGFHLVVIVQSLSHVRLLRPHGLEPTRLLYPWDSPGRNTGAGCHFLLQRFHLYALIYDICSSLSSFTLCDSF